MSVEDLKKFGRLCAENKTVQTRVKEIGMNHLKELMAYARNEHNLEFNEDDLKKLAKESGSSQEELSEDDLEKVAGGTWTVTADDSGFLVVK